MFLKLALHAYLQISLSSYHFHQAALTTFLIPILLTIMLAPAGYRTTPNPNLQLGNGDWRISCFENVSNTSRFRFAVGGQLPLIDNDIRITGEFSRRNTMILVQEQAVACEMNMSFRVAELIDKSGAETFPLQKWVIIETVMYIAEDERHIQHKYQAKGFMIPVVSVLGVWRQVPMDLGNNSITGQPSAANSILDLEIFHWYLMKHPNATKRAVQIDGGFARLRRRVETYPLTTQDLASLWGNYKAEEFVVAIERATEGEDGRIDEDREDNDVGTDVMVDEGVSNEWCDGTDVNDGREIVEMLDRGRMDPGLLLSEEYAPESSLDTLFTHNPAYATPPTNNPVYTTSFTPNPAYTTSFTPNPAYATTFINDPAYGTTSIHDPASGTTFTYEPDYDTSQNAPLATRSSNVSVAFADPWLKEYGPPPRAQ